LKRGPGSTDRLLILRRFCALSLVMIIDPAKPLPHSQAHRHHDVLRPVLPGSLN
jgi:hypothetical protein